MTEPIRKNASQPDFDRALAQRLEAERTKHKAEVERLEAEIAQYRTVNEAARGRVSELEGQVSSLTIERDTAHAGLATLEARHEALVNEQRDARTSQSLMQALASAKVLTAAAKHAADIFKRTAEVERAEDGTIVSVTYAGVRHESTEKAATAFLRDHPYLASAGTPGGGGTKVPTNFGIAPIRGSLSPSDLIEQGWNAPPRPNERNPT